MLGYLLLRIWDGPKIEKFQPLAYQFSSCEKRVSEVCPDIFMRDTIKGTTTRISVNSLGEEATGDSFNAAISGDGRLVAFDSAADNLVAGDTNAVHDVFVRDTSVAGVQQLSGMVVSNKESARTTLEIAKRYQEELSGYKSAIGASISRATTLVSTLRSSTENYAIAASQITDVDVAEEAANLVKTQILQQAASSILAQANSQPEVGLKLLQTS